VVIYSFNEGRNSSVWSGLSLKWYGELFKDSSMIDSLKNSFILAAISSISAAVIGTLGAVGMSKAKFRSAGPVEYLSTLPIMMPEIILGMIFLSFFSLVGIPFGMLTLVIAHAAFSIPYVLLLVKARLAGMDKSFEEAARDLGATELQAFLTITLPLTAPAIVSGMLLAIAMSFDDVIISIFVAGVNTNTLPIRIYTQIKTGVTPKTNALCTILFFATAALAVLSAQIGKPKKPKAPEAKYKGA
jgi:spermidine/putrescine transport system permease protein